MNFHENYFKLQFRKSFVFFFFCSLVETNFEYEIISAIKQFLRMWHIFFTCAFWNMNYSRQDFWIVLEPFTPVFFMVFFFLLPCDIFGDCRKCKSNRWHLWEKFSDKTLLYIRWEILLNDELRCGWGLHPFA